MPLDVTIERLLAGVEITPVEGLQEVKDSGDVRS